MQRAQKSDLGHGSHTGGSPQPMRMTLRLCCCRDVGTSAVAAQASRRSDRAMVLVQCSVAKRWLSCALPRARQCFSWRGSLRRRSRCKPVRSRSTRRAQPLANAKMTESKMAKDKAEAASARETHASAAPRIGRVAIRLRPGDWRTKGPKLGGGSPPLRNTAAPRQRCPRTPHGLPAEPYDHRNFPHALARRGTSRSATSS